jgi:hypothetical protein
MAAPFNWYCSCDYLIIAKARKSVFILTNLEKFERKNDFEATFEATQKA